MGCMLSWDDFRYVKAIAEFRSLAGAAEALGVNHSTVFRRLGQIEQQLGSRLFERVKVLALQANGRERVIAHSESCAALFFARFGHDALCNVQGRRRERHVLGRDDRGVRVDRPGGGRGLRRRAGAGDGDGRQDDEAEAQEQTLHVGLISVMRR